MPRGNRSQQATRRQLTICETTIGKLETEIERLNDEMTLYGADAEKLAVLYNEQQEVNARLEEEMSRWEALSMELEEEPT